MLLLCAMRGSIIIYQGEELGLTQADIPFDRLQDSEAIANWPHTLGRDGARTPMPWAAAGQHLGFSTAEPWLPAAEEHRSLAVDLQQQAAGSLLHFTRECLNLRKGHHALREGQMNIIKAGEQLLCFERLSAVERLRCTFNLSNRPAEISVGETIVQVGEIGGGALDPYGAVIEVIRD
jgi:alpha-glucosidase